MEYVLQQHTGENERGLIVVKEQERSVICEYTICITSKTNSDTPDIFCGTVVE